MPEAVPTKLARTDVVGRAPLSLDERTTKSLKRFPIRWQAPKISGGFDVGVRVVITGIQNESKKFLNGKTGKIIAKSENGRFGVKIGADKVSLAPSKLTNANVRLDTQKMLEKFLQCHADLHMVSLIDNLSAEEASLLQTFDSLQSLDLNINVGQLPTVKLCLSAKNSDGGREISMMAALAGEIQRDSRLDQAMGTEYGFDAQAIQLVPLVGDECLHKIIGVDDSTDDGSFMKAFQPVAGRHSVGILHAGHVISFAKATIFNRIGVLTNRKLNDLVRDPLVKMLVQKKYPAILMKTGEIIERDLNRMMGRARKIQIASDRLMEIVTEANALLKSGHPALQARGMAMMQANTQALMKNMEVGKANAESRLLSESGKFEPDYSMVHAVFKPLVSSRTKFHEELPAWRKVATEKKDLKKMEEVCVDLKNIHLSSSSDNTKKRKRS